MAVRAGAPVALALACLLSRLPGLASEAKPHGVDPDLVAQMLADPEAAAAETVFAARPLHNGGHAYETFGYRCQGGIIELPQGRFGPLPPVRNPRRWKRPAATDGRRAL
jgi:hypothetical protein